MEIWISKRFLQDGEFVEGNDSSALAVEPRMAKRWAAFSPSPKCCSASAAKAVSKATGPPCEKQADVGSAEQCPVGGGKKGHTDPVER